MHGAYSNSRVLVHVPDFPGDAPKDVGMGANLSLQSERDIIVNRRNGGVSSILIIGPLGRAAAQMRASNSIVPRSNGRHGAGVDTSLVLYQQNQHTNTRERC